MLSKVLYRALLIQYIRFKLINLNDQLVYFANLFTVIVYHIQYRYCNIITWYIISKCVTGSEVI